MSRSARDRRTQQFAGEELKKIFEAQKRTIDFVLSSSLARAMETAANQYPGHTVIPVPFISEHNLGADNEPADVFMQKRNLAQKYLRKKSVSFSSPYSSASLSLSLFQTLYLGLCAYSQFASSY